MIEFGLSPEEFRKKYFEKNFLFRPAAFTSKSISWDEVNHALYVSESTPLGFKVHKNGFVPEDQYTTKCIEVGVIRRKIIKHALHSLLAEGATIVYNRMESVSYPVRNVCNTISRFVGEEVIANGYIAFGEKESFGNHWDTHDVFAVQLIGRKRWKLFEPTFPLPLKHQTSKLHKHECPATPVFDEVLEAGDVLYIPRGWWHTAIPLMEETFHIAVGVHPSTVIDYVKWMADSILPEIEECRNSLGLLEDNQEKIVKAAEKISSALVDPKNYLAFQEQLFRNERVASRFDVSRPFKKAGDDSLKGAKISFNSKKFSFAGEPSMFVNGVQIDLDERYSKVVEKIAGTMSLLKYEEIEKAFPDFEKYEVEKIVRELASYDLIEIH